MLYSILRWIFIVSSVTIIFIVSKKFKKKFVAMIIGFAILACAVFMDLYFPVENCFVKFKTAEQAFTYYNDGDILNKIEGVKSGIIIYKTDDAIGSEIVPKNGEHWKIGSVFSHNIVHKEIYTLNGTTYNIVVHHLNNTDDFYIEIDGWLLKEKPSISDNKNSDFWCFDEPNSNMTDKTYFFFAYIEDVDKDYQLVINGELININVIKK